MDDIISSAEVRYLESLKLAMIGFGAQGAAEAANLRRSGISFRLGLRPGGTSWKKAQAEKFEPIAIAEALKDAETVFMNLPDQSQALVFKEQISRAPKLKRLVFAHGFNTHFGLIPVEEGGPDHWLIAPKGAASGLQEFYGTQNALPAILAIRKADGSKLPSTEDRQAIETLSKALGCHPKASIWADFRDETECDLFSEQALLCGGVSQLLRTAYEVLIEGGYHPEAAYYETLFELKLIVDLLWRDGITGMRKRISPTARYGDITRGPRVIDETIKKRMKEVLVEVQSGTFAKEFLKKIESPEFKEQEQNQARHPIEQMGAKLRERLKS